VTNLRIPGPTPCPDEVLQATARPMINHRGPEFRDLLFQVTDLLKQVYQTRHDLYILTASGTGAMEAGVVNFLSPGDPVLSVSIGVFGDRFRQIAEVYGARVIPLRFPYGAHADPEAVRRALREHPEVKAVLITHNETSTGITNPVEDLARVVREECPDALLVVDAISSLGLVPLPVDEWDLDVVLTASQKGFMTPPGLAFLSVSPRAWKAYETARMPRFYFDVGKARSYYQRGQTPFTPALSLFYGLEVGLRRILSEGLERVFERHARLGALCRERVKSLGLSLLAHDERYASNTVTAVRLPEGVDGKQVTERLRTEFGVVLAGGQQDLAGRIVRIGHMGWVTEAEVEEAVSALGRVLQTMGALPARR